MKAAFLARQVGRSVGRSAVQYNKPQPVDCVHWTAGCCCYSAVVVVSYSPRCAAIVSSSMQKNSLRARQTTRITFITNAQNLSAAFFVLFHALLLHQTLLLVVLDRTVKSLPSYKRPRCTPPHLPPPPPRPYTLLLHTFVDYDDGLLSATRISTQSHHST